MEQQPEKQNVSFQKYTGEKTSIEIESKTPITTSTYGEIFDCLASIGGQKKRFIMKKYGSRIVRLPDSIKAMTQSALKHYALARKAGLKVFPTFRMGEDETSILMTSGFSNDKICVGSNSKISIEKLGQPLIREIERMDEFLLDFFTEGLRAAEKGIEFNVDVFFFILSKNESVKIDFIIGDLDNLTEAEPIKNTGLRNVDVIRATLVEFCQKNISQDLKEKFLDRVEFFHQQSIKNINDGELRK